LEGTLFDRRKTARTRIGRDARPALAVVDRADTRERDVGLGVELSSSKDGKPRALRTS
jgi:hypothetical protein